MKANSAFMQYVVGFIGLMVVAIVVFNATIPTIVDAIASASLTGANLALANIVPTLIIVVFMMLVLSLIPT